MQRYGFLLSITFSLLAVLVGSVVVWRIYATPGVDTPASTVAGLTDSAQVHEQWVVALRDGDRGAALRLYAPGDLHDAAVDNQLQRMDSKLHSPSSTLGQLVHVTPEAPVVDGTQARGKSRWAFGNGSTLCFETKLNRDDTGVWLVTDYGTIPCT